MAIFSTSVIAWSAAIRFEFGVISTMTPLAAEADPDARGNVNPAKYPVSERLEIHHPKWAR